MQFVVTTDDGSPAIIGSPNTVTFVVSGAVTGPPGIAGPGLTPGGSAGQVYTKRSGIDYDGQWTDLPTAGILHQASQPAHNFRVGSIVGYGPNGYFAAQADSLNNADVVGIVTKILGGDSFILCTEGYVSGLGGLGPGAVHYLSAAMPGALTTVEPSINNQVSKPLLIADSSTSGYFHNLRGVVIGT